MKSIKHKTLHLPVIVEQDEDDIYIVSCPVFKGCHSYGKTIDEAIDNIKEVIDMCLAEEKERSKPAFNRFIGFRELEISLKTVRA
ncbi:MAG: type II toxin-antitoxin system HicB family antitoxin [Bacteroidetes bacterium]|nr:MAG: type II toxin-antitoxin system HicB family antitoxin [Bacteroidota bacterium]